MPAGGKRPNAGRKTTDNDGQPLASIHTSRSLAPGTKLTSQQAIRRAKEQELSLAVAQGNDCLIRTIILKQEKLLSALIDLAEGVQVEEIDREGNARVYQKPPDRQAAQWLLEKVHGKPTVKTETKHDTHISIHHEVPRPDPDDVERLESIALESKLKQLGDGNTVYEVDLGEEDEEEELLEID
jgi:hypothetical protein